jgi:hypothetical protein
VVSRGNAPHERKRRLWGVALAAILLVVAWDRIGIFVRLVTTQQPFSIGSTKITMKQGWVELGTRESDSATPMLQLIKYDPFRWTEAQGRLAFVPVESPGLSKLIIENAAKNSFRWGDAFFVDTAFAKRYLKPGSDSSKIALLLPGRLLAFVDDYAVLEDILLIERE